MRQKPDCLVVIQAAGLLRMDTHAVLLNGHIGQVYEHVVQFVDVGAVLDGAETTETQLVTREKEPGS